MMEKTQTILATISKLYENQKQVELEKQEKGEFLQDELRDWEYNITEKIVKGEVFDCIKKKFEEILSEIEELQLPMP